MRWEAYCRFMCSLSDNFNNEPHFSEPEAPWAPGGKPLDSRAFYNAKRYSARVVRSRARTEAKLAADKEKAQHEEERALERAQARLARALALAECEQLEARSRAEARSVSLALE